MVRPPVNDFRIPEKRRVTNVFVDLCGSTAAGEAMKDTRLLFELLDRWQRLTAFLFCSYGGRIGASDSDMVMGYFPGTEAGNLSPSRAILAARRIREQTVEFGRQHSVPLDVHIGVHCGDVEVGLLGPDIRANHTTIGPSVNIAARLQGKAGRGETIASTDVTASASVRCEYEPAGPFQLKGVSSPISCVRVKSVDVPAIGVPCTSESDWVGATLEAQALEETGGTAPALDLSAAALECKCPPNVLPSELLLLPYEICIRAHLGMRRPDQVRTLIDSYARLATERRAFRQAARARFFLALSLMQQADLAGAISAFRHAASSYEEHGTGRDVADAYYYAGKCYQALDQEPQAARAFHMARSRYSQFVTQQEADPVEAGMACLELSMLLADEPAEAIEVLANAERAFREACKFRHLVTALLNLSCIALRMLRPTHAENYARRALDLAQDFDPVDGVGLALGNVAAALALRGDWESAITFYRRAIDVGRQAGDDNRCDELSRRMHRVESRLLRGEP
jgi:class 3 adenylate cyclase/tetratricopeptide (TPR) repeat protein